jgi:DNA-binding transcriptional MerR regulator
MQSAKGQYTPERLTIGQIARLSGVTAKAIRYYESVGLLPPALRSGNGYRCYNQADVKRLALLRRLQLLGVSLETLKPLLAEDPDARCADVQQDVLRLIEVRMHTIDQEMMKLHLLHDQVECYHQRLLACYPGDQGSFYDCRDLSCLALPGETTYKEELHDALSNAR